MRTIQTIATVTEDGSLTVKIPSLAPGMHQVVLVIEEIPHPPSKPFLDLHIAAWEAWLPDTTFSRSEIYDDDGR